MVSICQVGKVKVMNFFSRNYKLYTNKGQYYSNTLLKGKFLPVIVSESVVKNSLENKFLLTLFFLLPLPFPPLPLSSVLCCKLGVNASREAFASLRFPFVKHVKWQKK